MSLCRSDHRFCALLPRRRCCGGLSARARRTWALLWLLLWPVLGGCGLLAAKDAAPSDPAAAGAGQSGGDAAKDEAAWEGEPIPYNVRIVVREPVDKEAGGLADKMRGLSQLEHLVKEPPDSLLALERRARLDVDTAGQLLQSQCYYEGTAAFSLDQEARPVTVTLSLQPGPRYTLGAADVIYEPEPVLPEAFRNRVRETGFWGWETEPVPPPKFPRTLPGVLVGEPVTASDMLAAVEALPQRLQKRGYPLAAVADAHYSLDREKRQLLARIVIRTGPPALMGGVTVRGNEDVSAAYVQRLAPWQPGEDPWNADKVEDYANQLRALGIFRTVEARPQTAALAAGADGGARSGADGLAVLPVEVEVAEAPFRSVGGSARYDTDTGLGVEGFWQHRNLFGNGEKLTLTAPIATETQGLKAAFEKPAFFGREQRLLGSASALRENTQAYEKIAGNAGADVERRLSRHWWGSLGLGGESGSIKDNERDAQGYGFFGPRAGLRRDSRNNILNPTRGSELFVKFRPYTGFYEESFNALGGSVGGSAYYAPFRTAKGRPDDVLVLAGRVEAGGLAGADLRTIPASLRYYSGGAGSVRGYAYQSLGPRDSGGDPLGGRSYQVVNLEARFKVAENVGLVPFLDGGMVYRDELPRILGDMNWGTGLGLRYYTPIGPLRLDVGVPLQPVDGDPPVQVYISIGQSF